MFKNNNCLIFVAILFLFPKLATGQITHKGIILDSLSREVIPFASITLVNKNDSTITAYSISDHDGIFIIDKIISDDLRLDASSLGYATKKYLKAKTYWNKIDTIELKRADLNLELIEVKAHKNGVIISGDTTQYEVEVFSNGRENNFEEVLKKMPGISVDEKGEISVGGKTVNKLLIEGDDFMNSNRTDLTQNIQAKDIELVEIIYNYKDEDSSNSLNINESEIAINLKVSPSEKKIKGEFTIGGGFNNKFDTQGSLYRLSGKWKYFVNTDFENTGRRKFNIADYFRVAKPNNHPQLKPASQGNNIPLFFVNKDKFSSINTRYIGSNISYKSKHSIKAKGHIIGLSSNNQMLNQVEERSLSTSFLNLSNNISNNQLNHLSTFVNLANNSSRKFYWTFSTFMSAEAGKKNSDNSRMINSIQFIDKHHRQTYLNNISSTLQLRHNIDSTNTVKIQIATDISNSNNNINFDTDREQTYSLMPFTISGNMFKQQTSRNRSSIDVFLAYKKYFSLFKYSLKVGAQRENISLLNKGIQLEDDFFSQNDQIIKRNYLWSEGGMEYRKNNFSIGIGLRITTINTINSKSKTYVQPTGRASLEFTKFTQRLEVSYNKSIKPIELPKGYGNYTIESLEKVSIFDIAPNNKTTNHTIQFNYRFFDYYSSTLFFIFLNHSLREEIRENVFYTDTYELKRFLIGENENSSFLISIIDKKFPKIKIGVRTDFIITLNEYFTAVSGIKQVIESKSSKAKVNFYSTKKKQLNIEGGIAYQQEAFNISNEAGKNRILSSNLKVLSPSDKKIKWEVGCELFFENQLIKKNYYPNLFFSIEYLLTKKENLTLGLVGNDLLHLNQTSRITINQNANNIQYTSYNTLPGYIILNLKYKL